jgi:hypothetical protein
LCSVVQVAIDPIYGFFALVRSASSNPNVN